MYWLTRCDAVFLEDRCQMFRVSRGEIGDDALAAVSVWAVAPTVAAALQSSTQSLNAVSRGGQFTLNGVAIVTASLHRSV